MIKAKCNGPAINQMVIADCYNCIIHKEEKKCRDFFFFVVLRAAAYYQ